MSLVASRSMLIRLSLLTLLATSGCVVEPAGSLTSEQLVSELSTLQPGDTLTLPAGTFSGSFIVPAGVTLRGNSTILVAEGGAALLVSGGTASQPTRIEALTLLTPAVTDKAVAAITAVGGDTLELRDLTVIAPTGAGIIVQGVANLTVERVTIDGQLTDASFAELAAESTPVSANEVSIAGLIVAAGDGIVRANATITDLTVRNVAGFGATFIDSITSWTGGRVEGCAGTGIYLSRSAHSWQGVTVANGRSASNSGAFVTGFGVIATESSSLDTTDLEIASIKGIGLFQSASRSQHLGARIVGNDSRGIWVQDSLATDSIDPELLLDQSVIMGNRGAGIQVLDGGGLVFQNGLIAGTRTAPVFGGLGGSGVVGDAIQLGGAGGIGNQLTTAGSVFLGNGRAGIAAENANSSLEATGSDSLFICGQGETLANWSCSEWRRQQNSKLSASVPAKLACAER
jgi:hypothetical protein